MRLKRSYTRFSPTEIFEDETFCETRELFAYRHKLIYLSNKLIYVYTPKQSTLSRVFAKYRFSFELSRLIN